MKTDNSLERRVDLLCWTLPPALILLATLYQIGMARWITGNSDVPATVVGIAFFSLIGLLLIFWPLKLINHWLDETERFREKTCVDERRLASIVNTTADAILSTDRLGRIVSWNFSAELLFGYDPIEIGGHSISVLFGHGASAKVESRWLVEIVWREGFIRRHETTCFDASGRMLNVELTATLLIDRQNEPVGMSVILRDITYRKHREQETRRLNTSLNQQASERTRELAVKVEQLAQANTALHQLDQTRSEFVSLVSHQIRAPLTNIAGAVQRMQADCGAINPTCTRMFTIFEQQVTRLNRLVQDVLNVTRIETGEMFLQLEPISALPVVRQAIEQVLARTPNRPINLADKPGLPLIYADRDRVVEVMINLLDNADKYSPPGQAVFVEVRADQSNITIVIRDSGPGLPTTDFERVFDKFYRADSSDSQTVYGYGLGLYICRRLVEAQNGRIWAENHPNGGAVFSFSLPVWQEQNDWTNDFADR